mmetsp:Transcript_15716/g.30698  ORF Transcript_15716/g.30698 Transcript_15716/m.30698 type:complete len:582 (+) Transcript_15716:53-1798(+)
MGTQASHDLNDSPIVSSAPIDVQPKDPDIVEKIPKSQAVDGTPLPIEKSHTLEDSPLGYSRERKAKRRKRAGEEHLLKMDLNPAAVYPADAQSKRRRQQTNFYRPKETEAKKRRRPRPTSKGFVEVMGGAAGAADSAGFESLEVEDTVRDDGSVPAGVCSTASSSADYEHSIVSPFTPSVLQNKPVAATEPVPSQPYPSSHSYSSSTTLLSTVSASIPFQRATGSIEAPPAPQTQAPLAPPGVTGLGIQQIPIDNAEIHKSGQQWATLPWTGSSSNQAIQKQLKRRHTRSSNCEMLNGIHTSLQQDSGSSGGTAIVQPINEKKSEDVKQCLLVIEDKIAELRDRLPSSNKVSCAARLDIPGQHDRQLQPTPLQDHTQHAQHQQLRQQPNQQPVEQSLKQHQSHQQPQQREQQQPRQLHEEEHHQPHNHHREQKEPSSHFPQPQLQRNQRDRDQQYEKQSGGFHSIDLSGEINVQAIEAEVKARIQQAQMAQSEGYGEIFFETTRPQGSARPRAFRGSCRDDGRDGLAVESVEHPVSQQPAERKTQGVGIERLKYLLHGAQWESLPLSTRRIVGSENRRRHD